MTNESREVLKMVFSGKQIAFSVIGGMAHKTDDENQPKGGRTQQQP